MEINNKETDLLVKSMFAMFGGSQLTPEETKELNQIKDDTPHRKDLYDRLENRAYVAKRMRGIILINKKRSGKNTGNDFWQT